MWKKILGGLTAVLVVLAIVVQMQPADFRVVRSASIAVPAADVFALINDFHKWDGWSPWAKIDPNMKSTFSGPPSGAGSVYAWVGNSQAGEGRMTILESKPVEKLVIKLDFIKPFEDTSNVEFLLRDDGGKVNVDWVMTGKNNFISKAFCLVMGPMDKMIGPDFEKGLAQLKSLAEAAPKK